MKNTKFVLCVLTLVATVWVTLAGKMDLNVAAVFGVIIGGYTGSNAAITRAALANGKNGEA